MSVSPSGRHPQRQRFSLFHSGNDEGGFALALAPYADMFRDCGRVMDVGCGPGTFLDLLKERGVAGVGIDLDPEMVAECRERGLEALVLDASAIGEVSGRFDGVHAGHVIEHMPGEAMVAFLEACHAKLKGGGILVIRTPNWNNETVRNGGFWLDHTHVRPYPLALLVRIFEDIGFAVTAKGAETIGWEDLFIVGRKQPSPRIENRRRIAFLCRPNWEIGGAGPGGKRESPEATDFPGDWEAVMKAYCNVFQPEEDVCLVLFYDPAAYSSEALGDRIAATLAHSELDPEKIPDILLTPLGIATDLLDLAGDRDWQIAGPAEGPADASWDGRILRAVADPAAWRAAL